MSKVSVIIPTYNRARVITRAIRSVLAQHYQDYEILVIDDGSTDNTAEVVNSYGSEIRYFSKENGGPGSARNYGLSKATGEYIAFLDSDDLWLPEKLKLQVDLLDSTSQIGLVFTDIYTFSELGTLDKTYFQYTKPYSGYIFKQLFMNNFIPTSTVMAKRHCFEKVEFFREDLPIAEDYDMWLRIAACFEIQFIPRPLVEHFLNPQGASANTAESYYFQGKVLEEATRTHPDLVKDFKAQSKIRLGELHYLAGRYLFHEGEYRRAFKEFILSVRCDFRRKMAYAFLFSFPILMVGKPIWRYLFKGKLLSILV